MVWRGGDRTCPHETRREGRLQKGLHVSGRMAVRQTWPVVVQLCGQGDGNAGEPFKDTPEVSCLP